MKRKDPLGDIDSEVKPVAYIHFGAMLALLVIVAVLFGLIWAVGGLVVSTLFWIRWINEQKRAAEARKITETIARQRTQAFNAPPPELLGDTTQQIQRRSYDEEDG